MTHWYNIYIYWITFTHTRTHNYIHLYNAGPVGFCGSVGWFRSAAAMPPMPPMPPQSQSQAEAADLEVSPGMHEMFKSRWRCSFFFCSMSFLQFPNFRMAWFLRFRSSNATEFMWFPCPFPLPKGYIIHTCIYYQGVVSIFLGVWRYSNQQVLCNQCSYIYMCNIAYANITMGPYCNIPAIVKSPDGTFSISYTPARPQMCNGVRAWVEILRPCLFTPK